MTEGARAPRPVLAVCAALTACLTLQADPASALPSEPLYVVIMNHVEGDFGELETSTTCPTSLFYQTLAAPPLGQPVPGPLFAVDIAGTDLLREILANYHDSSGGEAKLFIEPAGEFWQTEAHPTYGNKLFQKYDYQALGYEFGIQGHAIYYSGSNFCWYLSPHTAAGVQRKLSDLHSAAQTVLRNGQPLNGGITYTGGWKLEKDAMGGAQAESVIDHAAYGLGYRVAFEDHDAHIEDEPAGINGSRPSYYVYRADYGDGVQIIKIDFNGSVDSSCAGNTARCETPEEATTRFGNTVAARNADTDPSHVYFFAFTTHANGVWEDYSHAAAGQPLAGEGAGLVALMDAIESQKNAGTQIQYVTPSELAARFNATNPPPTPPILDFSYTVHIHVPSDAATPSQAEFNDITTTVSGIAGVLQAHGARGTFEAVFKYAEAALLYQGAQNNILKQLEASGHEVAAHAHNGDMFQRGYDALRNAGVQNITTVGGRTGIPGNATTFADTVQLAGSVGFTVLTDNWSPTDTFGGATWCSAFGLGGNTAYAATNNLMHPWRPDHLNRDICAHNALGGVVYVDHAIPAWLSASPPPLSDANFNALHPWFEAALLNLDSQQVNEWGFVSHQTEYNSPGSWALSPDSLAALGGFLTYIDGFVAQGKVRYATAREIADRFRLWESQLPPGASTQRLSGKSLTVRDKTTRSMAVTSADPSISSPAPDAADAPTLGGASVELVNPASGETDTFLLPAAYWKGLGNPAGSRGYRYADARSLAGPCRTVRITNGKQLYARCQGTGITFTLDEISQSSLAVRLMLGSGDRYCMSFGGTIVDDKAGTFRARNAPAPAVCP